MTYVSATMLFMLRFTSDMADDAARSAMKDALWELAEPFMREAVSRGMKVEAFVDQLNTREE